MNTGSKIINTEYLSNILAGDPGEFSRENRTFNMVSIISLIALITFLPLALVVNLQKMFYVIFAIVLFAVYFYYLSRFRKKYKIGATVFAICNYLIIIANYYTNSGINGTTIYLLFLTFHFLVASGEIKKFKLWIPLHIAVGLLLLLSEYRHPDWVPNSFTSTGMRFIDVSATYVFVIVFMFLITYYQNKNYEDEKLISDERADELAAQRVELNKVILQNQQLEKNNEEKNTLFSIVSHDLRAPMDSIKGYLEMISEQQLTAEEKKQLEGDLLSLTKNTHEMLLNILSWAKAQLHGVTTNLEPLKARKIIHEAAAVKKTLALKKGIKLSYSIDPTMEIFGDKDMLQLVLRNLINNSIKFTNPQGNISIVANKKGGEAQIAVKDNGIGIPLDKQKEIFSMQAKSTYGTNKEKGIGLGLMLCKEFIEHQHGKIWFESKPEKGTTFFISLPLASDLATEPTHKIGEKTNGNGNGNGNGIHKNGTATLEEITANNMDWQMYFP